MPRYPDDVSYSRPRETVRRDEKEVRRTADPSRGERRGERERPYTNRMDDTMDSRMDAHSDSRMDSRLDSRMDAHMDTRLDSRMDPLMDSRMDSRMDSKPEPRANTGRPVRGDGRNEILYRDMETGQVYQEPPQGVRRTPHQEDFDDLTPRDRPIINMAIPSGENDYNEYFVPGEGIDREVIQREICRYLGPDALCKPGKGPDGRAGFIVRAYRSLTSAMIKSLQESSSRLWTEREKRRRLGRSGEVTYSDIQDNRDFGYHENSMNAMNPMSMGAGVGMDMDMDMDARMDRGYSATISPKTGREIDPLGDPRMGSRVGGMAAPVGTANAYMQDPGFSAYSMTAGPPPPHRMQYDSRTYPSGNTPPPPPGMSMRASNTGYPTTGYAARVTQAPAPSMTTSAYRDPNADRMREYPYPQDGKYRR